VTYRGRPTFWHFLLDAEDPVPHVHACPECYEHVPCDDPRCTLEPDLELDDGTPAGSHMVCDACAKG